MNDPREPQDTSRLEEDDKEHHGYSPDVGTGSEEVRQAGDRAFGPPPPGPQWPGREPSDQERKGVPPTDTEARTPLGVGTSTSRRAEKIAAKEGEAGRRTRGTRGRSGRPYGTSTPEHATGVEPQGPADEESPHLPPGDQGG
ncbi:MAG: hypothetical protein JWR24_4974 [Actinoallomurus sp.]|jgi:hypothetical protein|nr:hypothetical protein [Actinoallomurus sp.]